MRTSFLAFVFAAGETRLFRAVFYDSSGHQATQSLSIALTCGGDPASDGGCVHPSQPLPASCKTREVDTSVAAACDSVCAGQGLRCGPFCTFGGPPVGGPFYGAIATYGSNVGEDYPGDCGGVPPAHMTDAGTTYAFSSLACCCY